MRTTMGIGFLLAGLAWPLWTAAPLDPLVCDPPTTGRGGGGAAPEVCATGCAAVPAPAAELDADEFRALVARLAREPLAAGSVALETLLFHGARTRELVAELGLAGLDAERAAWLERELARTRALLRVRLVNDAGHERAVLEARVPLDEKQHLFPELTHDLQPPEISGTVRRVGVDHLWARL